MQEIKFKNLVFNIIDGRIFLTKWGTIARREGQEISWFNFCEVSISGENKDTHLGAKLAFSTEWNKWKYVSHEQSENSLKIIIQSEKVQAEVVFLGFDDTNAVRVYSNYTNISQEEIVLEEASAIAITGLGETAECDDIYFTAFTQSHHYECQPIGKSFKDWGFYGSTGNAQKKISHSNVGSWSTKEQLPQGIISFDGGENAMFQIESNNSWYYEISDKNGLFYLCLGGANSTYGSWMKKLAVGESYKTVEVALCFGEGFDHLFANLTAYRRHIVKKHKVDENLPTVFNEYMHLSWDSPCQEKTRAYAQFAKDIGVEYYVIDCGWHDEVDAHEVYHYVGSWKESNKRFPDGVRKTTDYIRSLGLKAGLWIEPEVVGFKNQEMIDFYGDECFIQRNGKKVTVMNRHFLDFRHPKVRATMTQTIRRMVEDYGADYIKMDYNQDMGVGTDLDAFSLGEGLEKASIAYFSWVKEVIEAFPNVVFEGCSSGGMRLDYKTLSLYPLVSTSDQVDCNKYPYIVGNIFTGVLPEQAGVWSYPVGGKNGEFLIDVKKEWADENVDCDRVALNMINSILGRMHLASNVGLLDGERWNLVKEGVEYYNKLTPFKKRANPYLPCGFVEMGDPSVAVGLSDGKKIYLALYNLSSSKKIEISYWENVAKIEVGYPKSSPVKVGLKDDVLTAEFTADKQAVILEIDLEN